MPPPPGPIPWASWSRAPGEEDGPGGVAPGQDEAGPVESRFAAPVFKTEDAREGPKAFMEKRKPNYKGR